MSRPPNTVTWTAQDHTLAKIEIVKRYAHRWAQIVGKSPRFAGRALTFIDGFAGPGKYDNHPEGSPLAALKALNDARESSGADWKAGPLYAVFIEEDGRREAHLKALVETEKAAGRVKWTSRNSTFEEGIAYAEKKLGTAFYTADPLLVFIDPFGAKGVPWSVVRKILSSPTSEIILNFDADGIARILRSGADAKADEILTTIYGNGDWRSAIPKDASTQDTEKALLDLYRRQLRALPNVRYTFPFEMCSKSGRLNYYLLFASQNPLGLIKMKEVMKEIDKSGEYRFMSTSACQSALIRFDHPDDWVPALLANFGGRSATYADVLEFTLNDTLLINPSKLLYAAQEKGLLTVECDPPRARRNSFKADEIKLIRFNDTNHA